MKWLLLIIFIVVVEGVGAAIGYYFPANQWYFELEKSELTPPGKVFGIVWPILYLLIAIAGWRAFTTFDMSQARFWWLTQMLFNFSFNPLFFAAKDITLAVIILIATLFSALAFVKTSWSEDSVAAILFLPYIAWASFALYLISFIWLKN